MSIDKFAEEQNVRKGSRIFFQHKTSPHFWSLSRFFVWEEVSRYYFVLEIFGVSFGAPSVLLLKSYSLDIRILDVYSVESDSVSCLQFSLLFGK
jgi:hypothetical protein